MMLRQVGGDGYDLGVFYADIDLDTSTFAAATTAPASTWSRVTTP
ncbi:hypothetical protein [Kitasatospora sp. NPDC091207]